MDFLTTTLDNIRNCNSWTSAIFVLFCWASLVVALYLLVLVVYELWLVFLMYFVHQYWFKIDFKKNYGQWAVVTGATDGIGRALARGLAKRGMNVCIIGRDKIKLEQTKTALEVASNGRNCVQTIQSDLFDASLENYANIASQLEQATKRDIGVLFNCAGIGPRASEHFHLVDGDSMRQMINVNLVATVEMTRLILPIMIERDCGLIVNVTSILAHVTTPFGALYGPTKAFLARFTEQLQLEYAQSKIDFIDLAPGPVHTKLLDAVVNMTGNHSILVSEVESYTRCVLNALSARSKQLGGNCLSAFELFLCKVGQLSGVASLLSLGYAARIARK